MKEINIKDVKENLVKLIADDWFLIGAKKSDSINMMTASWGMIGNLWNKPTMNVYVRPSRYTYEFIDNADTFSCSFFDESYKKELTYCGRNSGRNVDKIKECHFDCETIENAPVYKQAKLTIICRKIASYDLHPNQFKDETILNNYKKDDFHRVYTGEILKVFINEE